MVYRGYKTKICNYEFKSFHMENEMAIILFMQIKITAEKNIEIDLKFYIEEYGISNINLLGKTNDRVMEI